MQVKFISKNEDVMTHDCLSSVALALEIRSGCLAVGHKRPGGSRWVSVGVSVGLKGLGENNQHYIYEYLNIFN